MFVKDQRPLSARINVMKKWISSKDKYHKKDTKKVHSKQVLREVIGAQRANFHIGRRTYLRMDGQSNL